MAIVKVLAQDLSVGDSVRVTKTSSSSSGYRIGVVAAVRMSQFCEVLVDVNGEDGTVRSYSFSARRFVQVIK